MTAIRIEGNCGDRGSREYNLVLGHRRADALRPAIMLLGVSDPQLEAVSFGKEKPVCDQHDEDGRWRNRRDDLTYRTK
jgi:peptidoglycan-associated lipoprotein